LFQSAALFQSLIGILRSDRSGAGREGKQTVSIPYRYPTILARSAHTGQFRQFQSLIGILRSRCRPRPRRRSSPVSIPYRYPTISCTGRQPREARRRRVSIPYRYPTIGCTARSAATNGFTGFNPL